MTCAYAWFWCLREVSPKDPMWADELLTRILSTDRSLFNMLDAVADGVDGSPPAYWLSMWAWTKVAGAATWTLRVPTTFWVVVATILTWTTFRLRYGFVTASVVTAWSFFAAPVLWAHAFEARHYGQLVAFVAAMSFVAERLYDLEKPSRRWWIGNALVHGILVNTHLFGFFYSGCGLLALAIADLRRGRFRWRVLSSVIAGWATFLPWVPSMLRQRRSTEWGYWAHKPTIDNLKNLDAFVQSLRLERILCLVVVFAILALVVRSRRDAKESAWTPAPIAGFLFVALVPALAWWLSVNGKTSVWVDRYMTPQFLGWAALFALISHRLGVDAPADGATWKRLLVNAPRSLGALFVVGFLATDAMSVVREKAKRKIHPYETRGLPVAAEMSHRVLEQWHYARQVEIYYLLDEASARKWGNGTAIDYKIMSALGRHYPVRVVTADDFLARYPRFLHLETGASWFHQKIDTRYRVTPFGPSLTLVSRPDAAAP